MVVWFAARNNRLPAVGANCAIGPVVGLSRSASESLPTAAMLASRILLKRSRYWFFVKNPVSLEAVSLVYFAWKPAGNSGYLASGMTILTRWSSLAMRWPSCQAMWLAFGTGRTKRSASERSERYQPTKLDVPLSAAWIAWMPFMARCLQTKTGQIGRAHV